MAKFVDYARIKRQVVALVARIPAGSLSTIADVGAYIDVLPRDVAYILAMLDDGEREVLPWHRVVAADAKLSRNPERARAQQKLLTAEGIECDVKRVANLNTHTVRLKLLDPDGSIAQQNRTGK